MSDAFNSVFDFDASSMDVFQETGSSIETFNPKPDGSKEYIVTLRLLPNLKNPQASIVHKKYYWLNDGTGFGYDSPSTPGINGFCPVSTHYWSLMNSKNPRLEKIAEGLRIQKRYVVFVQIVNDAQNPGNNGKILPWRMPVPVYKTVQDWLNPSDEAKRAGKKPQPLFNVFEAFNLVLTITNKVVNGESMRDYKVEKDDDKTAMLINGQPVTNTPDGQKLFIEHFNEQQPDLDLESEYAYVEADDALKTRVKAFLINRCQATNNFWPEIGLTAQEQTSNAPSITGEQNEAQQTQASQTTEINNEEPMAPAGQVPQQEEAVGEQPAQGTADEVSAAIAGLTSQQ